MVEPMEERQLRIKEQLNRCGLKATPQRVQVYDAMCALGHASADGVYQHLGGDRGPLTVATVYNVLESPTESGLLVRRPSFSNKMFFDVHPDNHFHLYRADTHEIVDFRDEALERAVTERVRAVLPGNLELDRIEIQVLCHAKTDETRD